MDTLAFLNHLESLPSYRDQIAHLEHLPPCEASYGELEQPLHPALQHIVRAQPLYSHQAAAINAVRYGKNVIIATPSASGKTLCYNLAVLNTILEERSCRALYLFPTKALAQDQQRALTELTSTLKVKHATFDGDTPNWQRAEIRRSAQIVLSNPDMLHLGILPHHRFWSGLLSRLRYVVIDEAHVYRGVFGSHVANVLRRLSRLCSHYGSKPQFILCSATIANPEEHAQRLTGVAFEAITADGSPHGGKDFVLWNPPLIDEACSLRRSANSEAAALLVELVRNGIRSLAFARSRRLVELIYIHAREQLAPELKERVKPYRAGYLPEQRRHIERELFEGRLLAVVATTALELGVDIGDLDATVLCGYPGSIASTWQQAGRGGRGREDSLSFLIALDNPLDQYLMRHPELLFGRSYEHALIDADNPYILKPHLLCASYELPLSDGDSSSFSDFEAVAARLEGEGLLKGRGNRWYPAPSVIYPAQDVNIRATSCDNYALIDASTGCLLERVEATVAFSQIHPGAIYIHQGESYLITELNLDARTAYALPTDATYYTQAKEITDIKVVKISRESASAQGRVYLGEVEVTSKVVGFRKKRVFTEEVIADEPLNLPAQSFSTVALWFDIPPQLSGELAQTGLDFAGGLHATEHAAIAMLPLFALCDRNDLGGVSTTFHPDTGRAQVFLYDAYPGGIGIAEKGFQLIRELWQETLRLISECPCEEGCPSCIQSPKCGNNNQPLDKKAAHVILEELLGQ
jgi:DEAD/DEAH box helicase domain-containing protein